MPVTVEATPPLPGLSPVGGKRLVARFDGDGWRELAIWDRDALAGVDRIEGPAVVEEPFATHFIAPGWTARLGPAGALVARRG